MAATKVNAADPAGVLFHDQGDAIAFMK
eukprot:SAG11_NODE_22108_length_412_cov_0.664537_1_plen_27_part_10